VANGVWYLIAVAEGHAAPVREARPRCRQGVVTSPEFAKTMGRAGRGTRDREGERLKANLWREYKLNTDIIGRGSG